MCSLYRKVVFDQPVVLKIFVDVTTAKKNRNLSVVSKYHKS